jgi:hypothetical protein
MRRIGRRVSLQVAEPPVEGTATEYEAPPRRLRR